MAARTETEETNAVSREAPHQIVREVDPTKVVFHYDKTSDTLMVHFDGTPRPAVSLVAGPNLYVRLDRARNEIVGMQLDNFVRTITRQVPSLLQHAGVFGITPDDVAAVRGVPWWRRRLGRYTIPEMVPATADELKAQMAYRSLEPLFPRDFRRAFV